MTLSYVCPHCHCFPLQDYILSGLFWAWKAAVQLVVWRPSTIGGPNKVLVIQDNPNRGEGKVIRAHVARQGLCDNLINTIRLLENQMTDGDSPVRMIVRGLLEKVSAE